jgi:hypothetical protein
MLRTVPAYQEIPAAEILFEGVPACAGARLGAGTTMARAADRVAATPHLVKYRRFRDGVDLSGDRLDILTHTEKFP